MPCLEERREALSATDVEVYSRLTDRFEAEWIEHPDHPPDPSDYLPEKPREPLSGLLLLHLLKVDLEYRSARGGLPDPDQLVNRYPALLGDTETLVEILAWGSRLEDGSGNGRRSGFDIPSLAQKFPALHDAVVHRRTTLYRELDGRFPADLIPEGYSLVRELKPGGMSRVALVWNVVGRREEVLKLNDPLSGDRAEAVRRFEDEVDLANRLTGQVVPVYRSGSLRGHLYYTMPYLRGGSLRERIDEGGLEVRAGVTLVRDVARAVDKLHSHRTDDRLTPIVHRDLKPENLLFAEPGDAVPMIADLGLAKLLDESAGPGGPRTSTGKTMGTAGYMAPEQILVASGGVGPAADVHALGAILYEILTGRRPFDESTQAATLLRTLNEDPAPPRQVDPRRAEVGLSAVAMKALKKVPSDRYPTAGALADDLDRWLERKPVLAREAGLAERLRSIARRYPVAASLAGLFLVSLMAGAAVSTSLYLRVRIQKERADNNAVRRATDLGKLMDRINNVMAKAGLTKQRSEIVKAIAANIHEVTLENDGLGSLDLGTALNHEAAALILLGKTKESLQTSERAAAVFSALPPTYESGVGLAVSLMEAGRILADLNQPAAGLERTEKSVAMFRRLLEQRPDDAESRFRMAKAILNIGNFVKDTQPERGIANYQAALDQLAILRRASHDAALHVEWDARTRSNIGLILTTLGRNDEAVRIQTESADLARWVVATYPDEFFMLDALATCQNNLGESLVPAGRFDEAEAAFNSSLGVYQRLRGRFPDETEFPWSIAMVQTNLAVVQVNRGRWQDAVELLEQAGSAYDALLKVIPNNPYLRAYAEAQRKLLTETRTHLPPPE